MSFSNPIFNSWYTDHMAVYRNEFIMRGNVDKKERKLILEKIPCRIYSTKKSGPQLQQTAAQVNAADKLSCDLGIKIEPGDELHVMRGGMMGKPERYFAGRPHSYYDPVGGVLSGLGHQEIALLSEEIIN